MRQSVVWITGLPGSGKTTLARSLVMRLNSKPGLRAVLLDGDEIREALEGTGYDLESRRKLAFIYQKLAVVLARQELVVVVATVSLFREVHEKNREKLPNYLEVFLDIPIQNLSSGLRSKIYRGPASKNPYPMAEFPTRPHVHLTLDSAGQRNHWLEEVELAMGANTE
jgi:adenylylsulfate kinase-like enzyme